MVKKSILILFITLLGGCQAINVHLFDGSNAKIELFNKIINNPEELDSIIKCSKFYDENVSDYFFKNKTAYIAVVTFLLKNKDRKVSLLYNKKFSMIRYPVQGIYKDGEDIYFHVISYIYVSNKSNSFKEVIDVIMISFVLHDSNWFFKNISRWNKEELDRLY